jgi:hypothetical protein
LLLAVLRPDLPQFEGKAMTGRALTYPIAAFVVPLAWGSTDESGATGIRTRWTSS